MKLFKTFSIVLALTLGGTMAAQAHGRGHGGHHHHHGWHGGGYGGWGGFGAGVLGGLLLGEVIHSRPPAVVVEEPDVVVAPAPPMLARDPRSICASKYKSFDWNTGLYTNQTGQKTLCPYLQ